MLAMVPPVTPPPTLPTTKYVFYAHENDEIKDDP